MYDWYGTPLSWITQPTVHNITTNDCFSWFPTTNLIGGQSCLIHLHALCSKPNIQYAGTNISCPSSVFVELNGKCFWLSPNSTDDIEDAVDFCRTEYGDVATFYSQTEMNATRSAILNTNITIGDVWLAVTTQDRTMYRFATGEPITWSNINPFHHQYDYQSRVNRCAMTRLNRPTGKWDIEHCHEPNDAICETKVDNPCVCTGIIIDDLCYWSEMIHDNIYDAQEICEKQNGRLAVPTNAYIDVKLHQENHMVGGTRVLLGATTFSWFTFTGEVLTRLNWRNKHSREWYHCVVLVTTYFKLEEENCNLSSNKTNPGLCSKEILEDSLCLGVVYDNTTCYWLSTSANSSSAAHVDCTVNGGFLAAILSDDVFEFLKNNFTELQQETKVWLGITTTRRKWFTKNTEQRWFNWHHQENPFSTEKDCVIFSASEDFKWSTVAGCPVAETGPKAKGKPQPGNMCMKEFVQSTTQPATTQPATTQITTQPTTTQPATTQITTQPTTTQPATTQQATTQPATTQPATTQQATTQPATTQPAATQPATTQPATTEQATTQPATTQSAVTQQATTQQSTTQPETIQPATTQQATTQPATTQQKLCSCIQRPPILDITNKTLVDELREGIKKNLTVPVDKISAVINKKISIPDSRPSSTGIGVIFIAIIGTIISVQVLVDSVQIFLVLKKSFQRLK